MLRMSAGLLPIVGWVVHQAEAYDQPEVAITNWGTTVSLILLWPVYQKMASRHFHNT